MDQRNTKKSSKTKALELSIKSNTKITDFLSKNKKASDTSSNPFQA
jgi:hypothetical protein